MREYRVFPVSSSSLGVTLPEWVVKALGIKRGDTVEWRIKDLEGKVIEIEVKENGNG